ncbi:hypothetical protein LJR235_002872 [Pararhizobium sp. LjRoot235]|uniref:DUF6950 family protein n=1 Tax=Pararhizobium sp. LjRoot235 TaxID=3342291 RepID=UPI003ECD93FA
MMQRLPKWRGRFEAVIDELKSKPFLWGDHDCGPGLVGNVVNAITGEDPAKPYRGKYFDAKGALRIIKRKGFANLGDMVASMLPEIHPSQAKIGDIGAIKTDSAFGYALGVVNGERVFVLMEDGIGTVDLLQCERAFKVG